MNRIVRFVAALAFLSSSHFCEASNRDNTNTEDGVVQADIRIESVPDAFRSLHEDVNHKLMWVFGRQSLAASQYSML